MLPETEENFCYLCHGDPGDAQRMVEAGKLSPAAHPVSVKTDFEKPSHHPVELVGAHDPAERFPAVDPSRPRHAECLDCHHHHYGSKELPLEGVSGVSASGIEVDQARKEYEVCYKCHSEGWGVSGGSANVKREFDPSNVSFHPVQSPGRNPNVPSLLPPYSASSVISCSDCHGSDDERGARGPHGSVYEPILRANYSRDVETYEDQFQFELCYRCHRRESILADESFTYHRLHLKGDPLSGAPGTSCATCHNAHGSDRWPNLIDFNPEAVSADPVTGRLEYEKGPGGARCFLRCHGVDHSPLGAG